MAVKSSHRSTGCAKDRENEEKDHFYATPPYATAELLKVERFDGGIWEPACGKGHISKVLTENGYQVISSDLVERGYGESRIDFLMEYRPRAPNIITNPPFKMANEFIAKGLALTSHKLALLMRLQALEGKERGDIFKSSPLARVHVFSSRLSCWKNGVPVDGGMLAMAWFVWEHGYSGKPEIDWIY